MSSTTETDNIAYDVFGEVDDDGVFAAIEAAKQEIGFDQSLIEDASGITTPFAADAMTKLDTVAEQDFRDARSQRLERPAPEKPLEPQVEAESEEPAEPAASEEAAKPAEPAQPTHGIDFKAFDLPEEAAAALAALPDDKANAIAANLTLANNIMQSAAAFSDFYRQTGVDMSPEAIPGHVNALLRLDHLSLTNPAGYLNYAVSALEQKTQGKISRDALAREWGYVKKGEEQWRDDDEDFDPWRDEAATTPTAAKATPPQPEQPPRPAFDPSQPSELERRHAQMRSQSAIEAWASEKDASGELKRPHLTKVMPAVIELARARVAGNGGRPLPTEAWDEVYQRAVLAHPELGAAEQTRLAAQALQKQGAQKAREGEDRVARAQRASRQTLSPAPGARPVGGADASDDDDDRPIADVLRAVRETGYVHSS